MTSFHGSHEESCRKDVKSCQKLIKSLVQVARARLPDLKISIRCNRDAHVCDLWKDQQVIEMSSFFCSFVGKLLQSSIRSPIRPHKQTWLEARRTFRRRLPTTTSTKTGGNKIPFHCGRWLTCYQSRWNEPLARFCGCYGMLFIVAGLGHFDNFLTSYCCVSKVSS